MIIKKMEKKYKFSLLGVLSLSLLIGCGDSNKKPSLAEMDFFNSETILNNVESYWRKDFSCAQQSGDGMSVFIDLSNGMYDAYNQGQNFDMLRDVISQMPSDVKFYSVANAEVIQLEGDANVIYKNFVMDQSLYKKNKYAPIEKTLKTIVSNNEDALFVTDFEEYEAKNGEQLGNFSKDYFTQWLKNGNTIEFYVMNFHEKNKNLESDKHVYFVLFNTPEKKIKERFELGLSGKNYGYKYYLLSPNFYSLKTHYPAIDKGGQYYDENGDDIVLLLQKYHNGSLKGNDYEVYYSQSNWQDIFSNSNALKEVGVAKPFSHFFRNLFIDLSNEAYVVENLDVTVTDITDDYCFYSQCSEVAKESHKPKLTKDQSGNSIFADDNDDPIAIDCYTEDGKIKSEWLYSPKPTHDVPEVFVVDNTLLKNSFDADNSNAEIGIQYHPNFSGHMANSGALLRIDVILKCKINTSELDDLFVWQSVINDGKKNDALSQGIKSALDAVNPNGKIIYSYFVKMLD